MDNNYDDNSRYETIGSMINKILSAIIDKINTGDFREVMADKIVDPIKDSIQKKVRPYIYLGASMYLLLVILLVIIIVILLKNKKKQ